ncbi:MAG: NnrS family protein [Gammaproteobacteria bacterium]|nr:MAG: NnrS family protein [Gammaproteobacteria bacterium]
MPQPSPPERKTTCIQIDNLNNTPLPAFSLFEFAFRPFFLFAALFSIIHLLLWVLVWLGKIQLTLPAAGLSPFLWHGHEMVFGYGLAIVIGFLLTAVTNWTGQKTMIRTPLMLFFCLWLVARIAFFIGGNGFYVAAIADITVALWFLVDFTRPVLQTRNHRQYGFIGKIAALIFANGLFYLDILGVLPQGISQGISQGASQGVYLGLYLLLAIVLVMGRRVFPFFTKRALGLKNDLKNPYWLDLSSIILFTIFCLWDVFFTANHYLALLSVILFFLYGLRLVNWYGQGLFKHPLIWVLWLANAIFFSGFLLKAAAIMGWINPFLNIHAFALGGIGLMTLGMMARVSLGHTGRNVFSPPKIVTPIFILFIMATFARVVFPLFFAQQYRLWIMLSLMLWAAAFLLFIISYAKALITPRVDGKPG